jgi:hypothetical protein
MLSKEDSDTIVADHRTGLAEPRSQPAQAPVSTGGSSGVASSLMAVAEDHGGPDFDSEPVHENVQAIGVPEENDEPKSVLADAEPSEPRRGWWNRFVRK